MPKDTLLVVDDEPNILKSLKRLFIDTDYKLLQAESAEKALELFEENDIGLIISDYRMPKMNGVELLYKVKEKYPETIRMILSGYADAGAIVEAINDGQVYKFVTKPWNDQELLTTVMRAFEQHKLQKENRELYVKLEERNKQLTELTKSLEVKVAERTRDLELKNRALKIAQNILNFLPVGVIGIDSEEIVVYINNAVQTFIDSSKICLGAPITAAIPDEFYKTLMNAMETGKMEKCCSQESNDMELIAIPLSTGVGVIGLFHWKDSLKYFQTSLDSEKMMGITDG